MTNSLNFKALISVIIALTFTTTLADIQSLKEEPFSSDSIPPITLPNLEQLLMRLDGANTTSEEKELSSQEQQSDLYPLALIAKLSAEIQAESEEYIKYPRVHFLNSLTTVEQDAKYLDTIALQLQKIGATKIPAGVLQKGIKKRVIASLTLDKQGRLLHSTISHSSKIEALDRATLDIIQLAAPYQPIPKNMSDQYDQVNIVRTFLFDGGK